MGINADETSMSAIASQADLPLLRALKSNRPNETPSQRPFDGRLTGGFILV